MRPNQSLRISVVIATFNRATSLKDTLESLARQVRPADEVIVVDNNSEDETLRVVKSFEGILPIKYVFEGRQGVAYARNTGCRAASGDIIVFTDDDCVSDTHWLYYMELPFLRDPQIEMVGGEIMGLEIQGSLVERFCLADAMLRVNRTGK